jgi:uncharacterized protein YlxW (UPF0749 family)
MKRQTMSEQPGTQRQPVDGRDRLREALRRPSRGQLVAAVLVAVLGFFAAVQVRATDQDDTYAGARDSELLGLINRLSLASQRAENEIAQLEQDRTSLLNDTEARRTAVERARQQADQYGILAGTVPAVGQGVRVTVKEGSGTVLQSHLLNGIQELRDAGAEAIEINDTVRVVAQTAIRDADVGGVVEVDGQQLSAPYVIDAIGPPHTLASGLDIFQGFIDEVEGAGGSVVVRQAESVEIASVREPVVPEYAEPVPTE